MLNFFLLVALHTSAPDLSPAEMLNQCLERYDSACAQQLLEHIPNDSQEPESCLLRAQTYLVIAELYRIEFEAALPSEMKERREWGRKIDEAAQRGLNELKGLEQNSEVLRIKADLLGTMIRTAYQAAKHRKAMIQAAEEALRLDPGNARAALSLAKPFLFAPASQGQDLQRAARAISHALQLDPELEAARVLHAFLLEKLEDYDDAKKAWKALLKDNPHCLPAIRALAAWGNGYHGSGG